MKNKICYAFVGTLQVDWGDLVDENEPKLGLVRIVLKYVIFLIIIIKNSRDEVVLELIFTERTSPIRG